MIPRLEFGFEGFGDFLLWVFCSSRALTALIWVAELVAYLVSLGLRFAF